MELNWISIPLKKLKQLVDELRGSMFNRLTQKQAEADDEIFCIRRTNQRRVETEAQIVKLKSELNKVESEKQSEHDKRQDQINTLKNEIDLVSITFSWKIVRDSNWFKLILANQVGEFLTIRSSD